MCKRNSCPNYRELRISEFPLYLHFPEIPFPNVEIDRYFNNGKGAQKLADIFMKLNEEAHRAWLVINVIKSKYIKCSRN
jgi:hypothetical protein